MTGGFGDHCFLSVQGRATCLTCMLLLDAIVVGNTHSEYCNTVWFGSANNAHRSYCGSVYGINGCNPDAGE